MESIILQIFSISGAMNVLLMKSLNVLWGECSDGTQRPFYHPVLQAMLMFIGQSLCLAVFKITKYFLERRGDGSENIHLITRGGREFSHMNLLIPALCDVIASILLFSGLYLTYATSFQMLRGVSIIFVGIFGSIYLNQTLSSRHWIAMLTIVCGVIILVSTDTRRVLYDHLTLTSSDKNGVLTGDLLIICAQVFHAAQLVYEEKYIKGMDIPTLQACGWQGIYGLLMTALLAIVMNFLPAGLPFGKNSRAVFDDFNDIIPQIHSNKWLLLILGIFFISAGFYNFAGITILKLSSAAHRIFADGLRLIFIWLGVLIFEWEEPSFVTCLAFFVIISGSIAYRKAIFIEWYRTLLARLSRRHYENLIVGSPNDANDAISRPADVI